MAAPRKTTSRLHSVRIAQGSALERLTEGKPFTEAVHRMAELFEKAINENWGPPPKPVPVVDDKPARIAAGIEQVRKVLAEREAAEQAFVITDQDGLTKREVALPEVLQLAAEQYPAGLVPVGLDEGDTERDTARDLRMTAEPEADNLSHLI